MNNIEKKQLILNPTENFPELLYKPSKDLIEGLYIDDLIDSSDDLLSKTVLFSGHHQYQEKIKKAQEDWCKLLHADHLSLRLLSGLHAHTVVFMGIGKIGDTVLLLPSEAGGHHSAEKILKRLGYKILKMVVDYENRCIDIPSTIKIIQQYKPEFIFIDRSDGLNYENFSTLTSVCNSCNIFDASQYLTHIISGQYESPFDMGFQFILSTLHKNFPGPQKALICSKGGEKYWNRIMLGINNYISSAHPASIIHAGNLIENHLEYIKLYGKLMLQNTEALEKGLRKYNVPMIERNPDLPITQQIWIPCASSHYAFQHFQQFEKYNILLNYRQLAYRLGYGLRIGTAAATLCGLRPKHCNQLAYYMSNIFNDEDSSSLQKEIEKFIGSIWLEGGILYD